MAGTFDLNTVFNAVLALFATVGFFVSIYFSHKSLKQAKELNKSSLDAQLFDKRYEIIEFFIKQLSYNFEKPDDFDSFEYQIHIHKLQILFNNYSVMLQASQALYNYFDHGQPLPDYASDFGIKEQSDKEFATRSAFQNFYYEGLRHLKDELGITEISDT